MSHTLEIVLRQTDTLTSDELEVSLAQASRRNLPLWDYLVLERQIPEDVLAEAFSKALNIPRVNIEATAIDAAVIDAVAGWLAHKHVCLPIRFCGKSLVLAMANPLDSVAIQDVEFASSRRVQPVVAARTEILNRIRQCYPSTERARARGAAVEPEDADIFGSETETPEPAQSSEPSAVVELCTQIILDAIKVRASDIHIEAGRCETRVRFRIDGVLREYLRIPEWMRSAVLSRIKILAKLDIAEQRLPQDGRIQHQAQDHAIDVRVSTLPTHFGEKAVLRLLGSAHPPTLSALGFSAGEMTLLDNALFQPQGLILVTGPTGAGKSTTLHSMLARRHSDEINTVTIEDPIEYQLAGASQVQVNPKAGVTFATSLRAILRQDPDVIMVGEIRDRETAEIAFHAALTGHLVLTTLHTNSSLAAIERLFELGIKPTTVTDATNLIMAQRLARRICMNCCEPYTPPVEALGQLRLETDSWTFQHGRGCEACGHTGYSGRIGIYEFLRLTPKLKEIVAGRATEHKLKRATRNAGVRFLLDDALSKVRQGLTTVEEILRVIRTEPDDVQSWNGRKAPALAAADKVALGHSRRASKPPKGRAPKSTLRRAAVVEDGGRLLPMPIAKGFDRV